MASTVFLFVFFCVPIFSFKLLFFIIQLNLPSSTFFCNASSALPVCQVVKGLDVLYELLRSSPPREQVQAVLLEWGVEQLYSLLLNPSFGDEARERVFRVRTTDTTSSCDHKFIFILKNVKK